jgi:N-methylhydantoinase B
MNGARPANPKSEQVLPAHARVELRLPGGGGYGDPAERDPAAERRDVEAGLVTR